MRRIPALVYGLVLIAIGFALAVPGAKLVGLGGSPYYVIAGALTTVAGAMFVMGKRRAAALFCAVIVETIVWALWEVGLDGWQLVPRVVAPVVLGIPLFIACLMKSQAFLQG